MSLNPLVAHSVAESFRVGALESGVNHALAELKLRFMRGTRCLLCCGRPAAFDLAKSLGWAHLTLCPIDDLQRALGAAAQADAHAAGALVPVSAEERATLAAPARPALTLVAPGSLVTHREEVIR